jgi:uncharacterized membrane protein (DUF2068 family)
LWPDEDRDPGPRRKPPHRTPAVKIRPQLLRCVFFQRARKRLVRRFLLQVANCISSRPRQTNPRVLVRKPILTTVRAIAVFEAAKGILVLLAGLGLLSLINRDVQEIAERFVRHSHLNPASHYPRIFLDASSRVTNSYLWFLAAAAAVYAVVRLVEAYGLWFERRWAEWFALVAGAVYVPVEVYELIHRATWLKAGVLLTNLAIVAYMAYVLLHPAEQDGELAIKEKSGTSSSTTDQPG